MDAGNRQQIDIRKSPIDNDSQIKDR